VENAAILTAVQLLAAASALREIRRRCDETLAALTEVRHRTVPLRERRAVLASLSNELSGMQTALSFEVESQIDAVHVPEIVIEQYQASLAGTLGLALAAETTSKMLDRLTAAIAAASGALERIERESDDDRRYRATLALAVLSVLAVPATLLLGFYGINAREVKGDRSVVDTVYWPAWAVLAAMCLIAAGVGLVLVRRRSQRGEAFEAEATRRLDYAQEQVARWEANEASAPAAGGGAP
jgi:Mg2+ and Co2+ transporter CorA